MNVTREQAQAAVGKYGKQADAAKSLGLSERSLRRRLRGEMGKAAVVKIADAAEKPESLRGFAVGADTRVSIKRPASTIRARLYDLKRGVAYYEAEVAREWVISPGTLRKHALDADCFRYIEVSPEKWEPCVMHPDTAKRYPVKK